jgi:hypothetical protein
MLSNSQKLTLYKTWSEVINFLKNGLLLKNIHLI